MFCPIASLKFALLCSWPPYAGLNIDVDGPRHTKSEDGHHPCDANDNSSGRIPCSSSISSLHNNQTSLSLWHRGSCCNRSRFTHLESRIQWRRQAKRRVLRRRKKLWFIMELESSHRPGRKGRARQHVSNQLGEMYAFCFSRVSGHNYHRHLHPIDLEGHFLQNPRPEK